MGIVLEARSEVRVRSRMSLVRGEGRVDGRWSGRGWEVVGGGILGVVVGW